MHIPLTDLLKFPWIGYKDLNTHLHFRLLKVEIKTSNSSRGYSGRHSLSCTASVQRITIQQVTFLGTFTMSFQNINTLQNKKQPFRSKIVSGTDNNSPNNVLNKSNIMSST